MNSISMLLGSKLANLVINGVLLSFIITGITTGFLKTLDRVKNVNAATTYSIWTGSLLLIFLVHAALWTVYQPNPAETPEKRGGANSGVLGTQNQARTTDHESAVSLPSISESSYGHVSDPTSSKGALHSLPPIETSISSASPSEAPPVSVSSIASPSETLPDKISSTSYSIFLSKLPSVALLFVLFVLGVIGIVRLARLVYDVVRLKTIQQSGRDITHLCLGSQTKLQLRRKISVIESRLISSPSAAGLYKGVVLLPKGLKEQLSEDALLQIVLHEVAHLERYDDWSILAQRLVESILFFNPLVWFVSARLDSSREMACDDWVVSRTGRPEAYVSSIRSLLEVRLGSTSNTLTAGLSSGKRPLVARMKRVLEGNALSSHVSGQQVAMLAGLSTLVLVVIFAVKPFIQLFFSFSDTEQTQSELVNWAAPVGVDAVGELEPMASLEPLTDVAPVVDLAPIDGLDGLASISASPSARHSSVQVAATSSVKQTKLSLKSWVLLLEATTLMSSDSERANVLRYAIERMPNSEPAVEAFLEAVVTLSSSSEQTRLLSMVIERLSLEDASMLRVIEAITVISSDSEKGRVIEATIRALSSSSVHANRLRDVIGTIGSNSRRIELMRSYQNKFE